MSLSWDDFYRLINRLIQVNIPLHQKFASCDLPVIVSLTSYPQRFKYCYLTLKCLLSQTVLPSNIVLWLSHADYKLLPNYFKELPSEVIKIQTCEDLRSYKKIIPSLLTYKNSYIVTADDDWFIWPTWLEELLESHDFSKANVTCHRAHRIKRDNDQILPYSAWERLHGQRCEAAPEIFPTNGAGSLFPPTSLDVEVLDSSLFKQLAPSSDDIWLYFMMRKAGSLAKTTGCPNKELNWPGSQVSSLWEVNKSGGNDAAVSNLLSHYPNLKNKIFSI